MQYPHIQKAVKATLDFQKFFDNARLRANDQSIWILGIVKVVWSRMSKGCESQLLMHAKE